MIQNLKHIIESLLFASIEPLTVDKIKRIVTDAETGEIREALRALFEEYRNRDGGFYLSEVAGGYQFRTQPGYNTYIRRMLKPNAPRLSKAALETLAIIAYKQPVIRSDVEHIRGVDCGGILRMLLERKLVRILGRKEIPGRPLIYATTKLFLEVFDLKDLKDLPTPKEIEEMSASPLDKEMDLLPDTTSSPAGTDPETAARVSRETEDPTADGPPAPKAPAADSAASLSTEPDSGVKTSTPGAARSSQMDGTSDIEGAPMEPTDPPEPEAPSGSPDSTLDNGEKKLDA